MSISVQQIRGYGLAALGATATVSQMKSALVALEVKTGSTGRYNPGKVSDNLSGNDGLFVFRAVTHLIRDSLKAGGDLSTKASILAGMLSDKVGSALSEADEITQEVVGFVDDALALVDYAGGKPFLLLWTADQLWKGYLEDFLKAAADPVTVLAGLYLSAISKGIASGPSGGTTEEPMSAIERLKSRYMIESHAVNQGEPVIDPGPDLTPKRPGLVAKAAPIVLIGGAAVAAAFILSR